MSSIPEENKKVQVLSIVGPTASGKTALAIELALKYNGEVISADSRQIYRGLDIGTEKVTETQMQGVPHHLIDIVEPETTFTVQDFQQQARSAIADTASRGKLPILAGGSGQYVDAVLYDTKFPEVPPNQTLRDELELLPTRALFKILEDQDPRRAQTIDAQNRRRLIRALEIVDALGSVPEQQEGELLYDALQIGIEVPKEVLKERILQRLNTTLTKGLIEETKELRQKVSDLRIEEFGLEYAIAKDYLNGVITKKQMEEKMFYDLVHYATRQLRWFRKNKDIVWFELPKEQEALDSAVQSFLKGYGAT